MDICIYGYMFEFPYACLCSSLRTPSMRIFRRLKVQSMSLARKSFVGI